MMCTFFHKLPKEIRDWEQDRINGAAFIARQAVMLAATYTTMAAADDHNAKNDSNSQANVALSISILRASMVPIVNVMQEYDHCRMHLHQDNDRVKDDLLHSLDEEVGRSVDLGVQTILTYYEEWQPTSSSTDAFVIGTFSRSSTTKRILGRVLQALNQTAQVKVLCSQSTPGDEGELMSSDISGATWLPDKSFQQQIEQGKINLVLVGADCILQDGNGAVNKVGTAALASCCKQSHVPIICCADRWKLWHDEFPPGLEDIFEFVPSELLDCVLVPDCKNEK